MVTLIQIAGTLRTAQWARQPPAPTQCDHTRSKQPPHIMEQNQPNGKYSKQSFAQALALGIAVGTAMGVAMHSMTIGIVFCIAFTLAFGGMRCKKDAA